MVGLKPHNRRHPQGPHASDTLWPLNPGIKNTFTQLGCYWFQSFFDCPQQVACRDAQPYSWDLLRHGPLPIRRVSLHKLLRIDMVILWTCRDMRDPGRTARKRTESQPYDSKHGVPHAPNVWEFCTSHLYNQCFSASKAWANLVLILHRLDCQYAIQIYPVRIYNVCLYYTKRLLLCIWSTWCILMQIDQIAWYAKMDIYCNTNIMLHYITREVSGVIRLSPLTNRA